MKINIFSPLMLVIIFCFACSKEVEKKSVINEKNLDLQVFEAYKEGKKSLEEGDVIFAAKKFNEAEILFPQSDWAPKAALMAAYSYYSQDYYGDAIAELKRFTKVYPKHVSLDYAYYLLAICYYEQIVDEKKDLQSIINAKKNFNLVINKFPITTYASDSKFKINLINDVLASKEMYVGRYYFDKKKWIPAINRFKNILENYGTTVYVEEAIHRLVEVHYIIGLEAEAQKYAKLLGYNYQSSQWYKASYKVFNKDYDFSIKKFENTKSKDKKSIFKKFTKKFKSIFE